MNPAGERFHIICERDVGLFSLIQQVIASVPWALKEDRIPVVYFGENTCYWTPRGYHDRQTVWEYYFEPLLPGYAAVTIPEPVRTIIRKSRPVADEVGYFVDATYFVSTHFGDHPSLRGDALAIPYRWDDPDEALRREAKGIIDDYVRPRDYILRKADAFFTEHLSGHYVIGVHARGTDATSKDEHRSFRQGSLVLSRYMRAIERLLDCEPAARIFVASDEQESVDRLVDAFGARVIAYDSLRHHGGEPAGRGPSGWIMPAYIAGDRDAAARNGEDAVVEYLLLSRCDQLVHNGSSLARTVLLNAPALPHLNTHHRPPA